MTVNITEIKGVIPALITPFDEKENYDEIRMKNIIDYLINEGVDGLYLTGSTGEGFLMTTNERKEVVDSVMNIVDGRVPIIVHIGAISTKVSIELAKHAKESGADAISSVPPFYWNFSDHHIFTYYKDISDAVDIPMIVYNVPLAGLFSFDLLKDLATIENVRGVKYTAYTHQDIHKCKSQISENFMVYSGADEMAVSGLFNGADGIIGSFYSMLPDLYVDLFNDCKNGDLEKAQEKQRIAVDIIEACLQYDYYSAIKVSMNWMGIDAGYVRRPFKNMTDEEMASLRKDLIKIRAKYENNKIKVLNSI